MKSRNVEEAKRERDQKLRQLRRRQNSRSFGVIIVLVSVIVAAILAYNSSFWRIRRIEIEGGKHFSAAEIRTTANIPPGTSLLKFSGAEIGARIARSPWVKKVVFSRKLPGTLIANVYERQPFAVVNFGGVFYLIDKDGFVLTKWQQAHNFRVPIVNDLAAESMTVGRRLDSKQLDAVSAVLSNLSANLRNSIVSVSVPNLSKLALYTKENLEIVYGPAEETAKKNLVIEKILEAGKSNIIYINVTIPENPVVRKISLSPKP